MKLHEQLASIRKGAGYTLRELESASGITDSRISEIEKGRRDTTLATMNKILEPLGKELAIVDKHERQK